MTYGFSDVVYTIKKGSARSEAILKYLAQHQLLDLRFGLNLVTVKSKNPLGDINNLADTLLWVSSKGFRIHLYLFLSDDIANAAQGGCPEVWKSGLLEDIAAHLEHDCLQCLDFFKQKGITISSYTVGNESEWGICGYRLRDRVSASGMKDDDDVEWLRQHLWQPTAFILGRCCKALKRSSERSTILIHSDSIGKERFTYEYIKFLCESNVPFDAIGLTYNPWTVWDSDYHDFEKIGRTVNKLREFDKPVWIVEYCYPNTPVTNGELTPDLPRACYSYTQEGQTSFHLAFIQFCREHNINTLFFWRGEHALKTDLSCQTGIFYDGKINEKLLDCISGRQ